MIFGRYYDIALWMISSGNMSHLIIDVLGNIPDSMLNEIRKSLLLYPQFFSCGNNDKLKLNGKFRTSGDMLYWYSINPDTGALDLGECIDDGEECYNTFQMTLYPLRRKNYMNMESFSEYLLGDISYNYVEEFISDDMMLFDFDTMKFELVKYPFNIMMLCSGETTSYDKNINSIKNRYNIVNVSNIPKDYNLPDLRGRKRFVRCRRLSENSK